MKQYLLSVHYVEGQPEPDAETVQQMYKDVSAFNDEIMAAGQWVFGGGLHTPDVATVVSVVDGRTTTTDGPFAEAKEHIGGFWVLAAEDLDAALALAERASTACRGPVEVRPFQDDTDGRPQAPG
jgi:hypothetical protein